MINHHHRRRPVRPAWQLSQREIWAMLSRPHFTRFTVVVRQSRTGVHTQRRTYDAAVHTAQT